MKALMIFLLISTTTASFAMPYRCTSRELIEGAPLVVFKINPKQNNRWIVGITPAGNYRLVAYGQGQVSPASIGMSFVDNGAISGYLQVFDRGEPDALEGEFRHYKVSSRTLHVRCLDVALTEPAAPTGKVEVKTKISVKEIKITRTK